MWEECNYLTENPLISLVGTLQLGLGLKMKKLNIILQQRSQVKNMSTESIKPKLIKSNLTTDQVVRDKILDIEIESLIGLNEMLNSLHNREDYKLIKEVLDKELNVKQKQVEIEKLYLTSFIDKKVNSIKHGKFIQSSLGQLTLIHAIKALEEDLNKYKNSGKYSKGKKYSIILKSLDSSIIISNVLSIVIPFIYKHVNLLDQIYQNLIIKAGKSLTRVYIREEYSKYINNRKARTFTNNKNEKIDVSEVSAEEMKEELSYKAFSDKLMQKIGPFSSVPLGGEEDYAKLGQTLLYFMSLHSDLFTITEVRRGVNESTTVVSPGKYMSELLNSFALSDISTLPMISKPAD